MDGKFFPFELQVLISSASRRFPRHSHSSQDIVERAGRLAGVHMALASMPCCISKVRVLGLKTLQYSTNSTKFGVATVHSFHPGFPGDAVPFCRNFERILESV